jgi:hypothetical protein
VGLESPNLVHKGSAYWRSIPLNNTVTINPKDQWTLSFDCTISTDYTQSYLGSCDFYFENESTTVVKKSSEGCYINDRSVSYVSSSYPTRISGSFYKEDTGKFIVQWTFSDIGESFSTSSIKFYFTGSSVISEDIQMEISNFRFEKGLKATDCWNYQNIFTYNNEQLIVNL